MQAPSRDPSAPKPASPTLVQRLTGGALSIGAACVRALPSRAAYALADLASLAIVASTLVHERHVGPKGRGLFRNQRIVFREELSAELRWRLLFGWARHFARLAIDFCRMPQIQSDTVERYLDPEPIRALQRLGRERGGLLCVTGHIGVWEMAGHAPSALGSPVTIVVRPLPGVPLNDAVTAIRESAGERVVSKWGVLYPLKKALDRGDFVGLVADEEPRERPVFAPFLGTLAATSTAAAFLHRTTRAPLAVVAVHRIGRERFRFHCYRLIDHEPTEDRDADLRSITEQISEALSDAIRAHPEQWNWGSRRFLRRPDGELPGPDGLPPRA